MNNLYKLLVFLFFFGSISLSTAQDIHFSQFYMSPMHLNPAMTGVMNCNSRITANFRNQWASVLKSNAYNTFSASYDQRFTSGRYDYFGAGLSLWGDKAGQLDFSTLQAKLSGSYAKRMGGYRSTNHYLVVGAEVAITQRGIDFANACYGNQFNGEICDQGLPSFETNFDRDGFIFPDLGAGILWFSVFDDHTNFFIGGAFQHLNTANQSFTSGNDEPLYSKITIHAGGEKQLNNKLSLVPGAIWLNQGPSMEINAGTSLKFLLNPQVNNAFQVGLWWRISNHFSESIISDALILSTRFDYGQFSLGFSYDLNVSSLKTASNYNGSFEFALQYLLCGPEVRNVYCPRF